MKTKYALKALALLAAGPLGEPMLIADIAEREDIPKKFLEAILAELKQHGATWIKYVGLIVAPEGVQLMLDEHPDVPLHVALLDRELDENKYIRPGLGDAGDRLYGTAG